MATPSKPVYSIHLPFPHCDNESEFLTPQNTKRSGNTARSSRGPFIDDEDSIYVARSPYKKDAKPKAAWAAVDPNTAAAQPASAEVEAKLKAASADNSPPDSPKKESLYDRRARTNGAAKALGLAITQPPLPPIAPTAAWPNAAVKPKPRPRVGLKQNLVNAGQAVIGPTPEPNNSSTTPPVASRQLPAATSDPRVGVPTTTPTDGHTPAAAPKLSITVSDFSSSGSGKGDAIDELMWKLGITDDAVEPSAPKGAKKKAPPTGLNDQKSKK